METWVCAGRVLASNGDMGVCWVGAAQLRGHGRVLISYGNMDACAWWMPISNGDMVVR